MPRQANKVTIDVPAVSRADAQTFMIHHLLLAAAYFEAVHEGRVDEAVEEAIDNLDSEGLGRDYEYAPLKAIRAFLTTLEATYEEMKRHG